MKSTNKESLTAPAILFDVDGTLIDSVYEHVSAWSEALRSAGIVLPKWRIHRRIGMSGKSFLRELLRPMGRNPLPPSQVRVLEQKHDAEFSKVISSLQPLPGAKELLKHLSAVRVKWAIATTGNSAQTKRLLKLLKIPKNIPVITGDDVAKTKPAPDAFVLAAGRLGVSIRDSIVVGDSTWDLLAAVRKSALGVGMLSGGSSQDELERAGAFRVYADPDDMLAHLEQLGIPGE
ncbi:MAG TPA: HAD family phosphatase [Terriglobales bacterium]|jgi:HAD superfamily hydrolase (TIGR01549 family)|nr:HAD family phosphatase [Terriglobales bacterium]